jgi:hypothetical protein
MYHTQQKYSHTHTHTHTHTHMLRARSSYRTARQSDRATRWPHHAWRLVDADRARQTPNLQRQANNSCASIEDYRRTREPSIAVKDQAWSSCEHPVFFLFFRQGYGTHRQRQDREARLLDCQGKGDGRQARQRHRPLLSSRVCVLAFITGLVSL